MDDEPDNQRPPYRIPGAARALNVSDQSIRQAIKRGELDAFRLGKIWLIRAESIERLRKGS